MNKGFLTDMVKYLPAQVVPGIVGLVSIPIVTHIFPPAEYGNYNLAMATVVVLSTVFGWLPTSVIRYYPAYARQGRLEVFNTTILSLGAIALILLTGLYYVILLTLRTAMSASLWNLLVIGGLLFVATCAFSLFQAVLRSRRFGGRYSTFAVWQSVAGFGLGIALILLLGLGIEGLLLGATLSIVPALPWLWREAMDEGGRIRPSRMDPEAVRATFTYGLPLMVGNLAAWVLSLSDRYVLGLFRDSSEVGLYSLSYNLADKSLMLLIMLFLMAESAIGMHIWENRGEQESKRFVSDVTRFYLLLCVPAAAGLSALSKLVVSILAGPEYVDGHRIVPFVLFGVLLLGLQQRFHWGFLFHQKTRPITVALVLAGLLKISLNVLFVPKFGYFAAAVTTFVCYAVLLALVVWFSRRLFTWKFPYKSLVNVVASSSVMGLAMDSANRAMELPPAAVLALCIGIGAAVYTAALLLLGEFSSQELAAVRRVARGAFTTMSNTGRQRIGQSSRGGRMTSRRLVLLLSFTEDDTKMASVRWKRFRKHLHRDGFSVDWRTVKLPFCDESAHAASKMIREFKVLRHARRLARQLLRECDPQEKTIVLASIPTLEPLYVGAMLKRIAGANIELILEIRDVYARPEVFEYKAMRRCLETFKERMFIGHVDRLIFLTEEIKRRYCAYYPRLAGIRQGVVITNGYDFEEYGAGLRGKPHNGLFEIGYFGSFYGSRNPELLFQTLGQLRQADPEAAAMTRVHIWGDAGQYPLQEKIRQYDLQDTILYHGISSHESIMREYAGTAVNLIITHTTGSGYALPGKLFEYVGARRPIWAITDDQILREFVTRYNLGYLSSHDARSIEETLLAILHDHANAGRLPGIDPPGEFEIGSLTRDLERFLEEDESEAVCGVPSADSE